MTRHCEDIRRVSYEDVMHLVIEPLRPRKAGIRARTIDEAPVVMLTCHQTAARLAGGAPRAPSMLHAPAPATAK